MNPPDEYLIDKAYQKVYRFDNSVDIHGEACYYFYLSFYQIGATIKNRPSTIIKKIEQYQERKGEV